MENPKMTVGTLHGVFFFAHLYRWCVTFSHDIIPLSLLAILTDTRQQRPCTVGRRNSVTRRPEVDAVESWLVELIRATGLRADPFSLYGYTHGTGNPYGVTFELSDGSSYKLPIVQLTRPTKATPAQCKIRNCDRPVVAKGLCKSHYNKENARKHREGAPPVSDDEEE